MNYSLPAKNYIENEINSKTFNDNPPGLFLMF